MFVEINVLTFTFSGVLVQVTPFGGHMDFKSNTL